MYRRILMPIDGGPCSDHAVRWGLGFAQALGAEVTFVHVVPASPTGLYHLPTSALYLGDVARDLREAGRRALAGAKAQAQAAGVPCDAFLLEDDHPARAILGAEASHHLSVMATHSRRGLDRLFLGSVTEAVLRRSSKPHLILRCPEEGAGSAAHPPVSFRRLLLPLDGSDCGGQALEAGLALAQALGASVTLLHALEVPVSVYTMPDSLVYEPTLREDLQRAAEGMLERAARRAEEHGVAATVQLIGDDDVRADRAILDAESRSDLTVMATHGRRGVERALLGSVTERVLRQSGAPHLIIRCAKTPQQGR